jgi:hypothetical protein
MPSPGDSLGWTIDRERLETSIPTRWKLLWEEAQAFVGRGCLFRALRLSAMGYVTLPGINVYITCQ